MFTIEKTDEYEVWFSKLRDPRAKSRIEARLYRFKRGNPGDHKDFGNISELRIDYGPGYRVYYAKREEKIILLLLGGDKSRQSRDIERARELLSGFGEQEKSK